MDNFAVLTYRGQNTDNTVHEENMVLSKTLKHEPKVLINCGGAIFKSIFLIAMQCLDNLFMRLSHYKYLPVSV